MKQPTYTESEIILNYVTNDYYQLPEKLKVRLAEHYQQRINEIATIIENDNGIEVISINPSDIVITDIEGLLEDTEFNPVRTRLNIMKDGTWYITLHDKHDITLEAEYQITESG